MLEWSRRLSLHGPQAFRRHGSTACAATPALPPTYEMRAAGEADVPSIMERLPKTVATSAFGTQNFVIAGWAEYSESTLRACIAESHGISTPARHRVCSRFNGSGEPLPRVFANLAIMHFGTQACTCSRVLVR